MQESLFSVCNLWGRTKLILKEMDDILIKYPVTLLHERRRKKKHVALVTFKSLWQREKNAREHHPDSSCFEDHIMLSSF
ncbi:rCG59022 [Rattus norvegicus]|uniref:RCG59022 n=1 Tax=Rattus norvegicus TaxID=10116 RepID=A6JPR2_RAT|nr:rCG59022 [Rattus norvegicus]